MKKRGFSLMEMMIVLLIVAIIAAASAPMVSKKMMRDADGGSPWIYAGLGGSVTYNPDGNGDKTAMIGTSNRPSGAGKSKLYIETIGKEPHLAIGKTGGSSVFQLAASDKSIIFTDDYNLSAGTVEAVAIGYDALTSGDNSTALGAKASASAGYSTALGYSSSASGSSATALGHSSTAKDYAAALGYSSSATGSYAAAVGDASASGTNSMAFGRSATASSTNSVAIGYNAKSQHSNSVAIGRNAKTTGSNQIVLGTSSDKVIVPGTVEFTNLRVTGKLEVEGNCELARTKNCRVWIGTRQENGKHWTFDWIRREDTGTFQHRALYVWKDDASAPASTLSDRRLKNIGEVFTGGLEKIKQLKVYNYTFKDDKDKTPRVGVIAQDLKKVFPDAVAKGEDGFLRIRWEDIFYALVNAVKELDLRITTENTALKKRVAELEKQNKDLEKRLSKLESKVFN